MKKSLTLSLIAMLITASTICQTKNLPAPSIIAGGDLILLANGAGIHTTALLPVSRVLSIAGSISYDFFFNNYSSSNMKKSNFAAGVRLGVPNDVYTQISVGYSTVSSPPFFYNQTLKKTYGAASFKINAGIQLENNIELGGEIFSANYGSKNYGGGSYLFIKATVAYVFRFKKQKK